MKVTFLPGIDAISGTMKGPNGERLEFRPRHTDKAGHGHLYIRKKDAYKRKKPLSKKAADAQQNFANVMQKLAQLTTEQRSFYKEQFIQNKGVFNGKKYKTLRAYTIGRLYHLLPTVSTNH